MKTQKPSYVVRLEKLASTMQPIKFWVEGATSETFRYSDSPLVKELLADAELFNRLCFYISEKAKAQMVFDKETRMWQGKDMARNEYNAS